MDVDLVNVMWSNPYTSESILQMADMLTKVNIVCDKTVFLNKWSYGSPTFLYETHIY